MNNYVFSFVLLLDQSILLEVSDQIKLHFFRRIPCPMMSFPRPDLVNISIDEKDKIDINERTRHNTINRLSGRQWDDLVKEAIFLRVQRQNKSQCRLSNNWVEFSTLSLSDAREEVQLAATLALHVELYEISTAQAVIFALFNMEIPGE